MTDEIDKLCSECKRLALAYAEARTALHCDEEKGLAIEAVQASKALNEAIDRLAALAQRSQREPLSIREIDAEFNRWGCRPADLSWYVMGPFDRTKATYVAGFRDAERLHGIKDAEGKV